MDLLITLIWYQSSDVDTSDVDDEDIDDLEDGEENFSLLDFDASKCINKDGVVYTLRADGNGFYVTLDEDQKTLTLSVDWATIYKGYFMDRVNVENQKFTINFSQEVEDIFIGVFGQSATGDTVLFLMQDGSVNIYLCIKL